MKLILQWKWIPYIANCTIETHLNLGEINELAIEACNYFNSF
jgi:hypothetical protein